MSLFVTLFLFGPGAPQESPDEMRWCAFQTPGRILIYSGSIDLEVMALDTCQVDILRMVDNNGGYLEKNDAVIKEGVALSVRIPREAFSAFLEELAQVGTVRSLAQNEDDVTDQLLDSRLQTIDSQTNFDPNQLRLGVEAEEAKLKKLKTQFVMASLKINLYPKLPKASEKDR